MHTENRFVGEHGKADNLICNKLKLQIHFIETLFNF